MYKIYTPNAEQLMDLVELLFQFYCNEERSKNLAINILNQMIENEISRINGKKCIRNKEKK